jgi:type I site-specific restriction endonuclease
VDSGWTVLKRGETSPDKGAFASEEYPTSSGPADYVLVVDGNSIGIVEAKKSGESVYGALTQAQRYARDIEGTNYNFDDSEEALTTIDGEEIKPMDYLKALEEFVTQNEDEIEALKILIEKPADFDIEDLKKLRDVLAKQPQIFTEERLILS